MPAKVKSIWVARWLLLALTIFLPAFFGCATSEIAVVPPGAMPLYFDEDAMHAEVLKYIQINMPVDDAKKIMESHGFKCRIEETSRIFTPDIKTPNHLYCLRIKPQPNPGHEGIVLDEICVYLPVEAGKVQSVKVRHIKTSM